MINNKNGYIPSQFKEIPLRHVAIKFMFSVLYVECIPLIQSCIILCALPVIVIHV